MNFVNALQVPQEITIMLTRLLNDYNNNNGDDDDDSLVHIIIHLRYVQICFGPVHTLRMSDVY